MVEIVHWNPRRFRASGPLHRLPAVGPRINNFGDLLGPFIANRINESEGRASSSRSRPEPRLLTVGSILTLARPGDTVWGTGVNGKSIDRDLSLSEVDIRAVRGPLTRDWANQRGGSAPSVFGDPALLLGPLFGREELAGGATSVPISVVPNFHDYAATRDDRSAMVNPRDSLRAVLRRIASSDFVCGSSLHGVIVAEALGIPARFIASDHEPRFKYDDYMLGTGREPAVFASSVEEARDMGGQTPPVFDHTPLLDAFPRDLWP